MRETLLSFLDDCARRGQETALAQLRGLRLVRWSYGQLRAAAYQFARELEARGLQKGDRLLLWSDNCPQWVAAFFGCLLRGVIVVPLDRHSSPEFAERVQRQVQAKLLLHDQVDAQRLAANLPTIELDGLAEQIAHHSDALYTAEAIRSDDLIEIIFTSGTTAEPKGVCLTHKNICANLAPLEPEIQKYLRWERFFHPIRFLNLVPLSHVFGQFMGIFVPQLIGGEVFFQDSLSPSEIIATVKRERISVIVAVPRQIETLSEKIKREYVSSSHAAEFERAFERAESLPFVRRWWTFRRVHRRFGWKFWAFVSGGATLDSETETFWRRLGYGVVQGYGMTETASLISVNHPFKMSRGSIGKAMPGQEMKLDANGEILVRGENVSVGYWEGGFRPLTNTDGWLHTGDIGERDATGNLFFKGRKKDVIVTAAGLNIYPDDLEAALHQQPEVRDACVIAVETAKGAEPMAVMILNDSAADATAIIARANRQLADYQHLRRWHIWSEADFPRTTTTRKIIKRTVAEAVQQWAKNESERLKAKGEGSTADGEPAKNAAEDSSFLLHPSSPLLDLVATASGNTQARVDAQAKLASDLQLDSLGRVELMSAIEDRFQIEIDEGAFTAATTVADIEKMIGQGQRDTPTPYPYPKWARRFPARAIRRLLYYSLILPITRLMCWVRVRGAANLPRTKTPVLFIANHISMADHGLILSALPWRYRHQLAIAMEGERLRSWLHPSATIQRVVRLWLRIQYLLVVTLFNVFPLPQQSGFRRSFAYAGECVDQGMSLLVFPEGRTTADGQMQPFMNGIGLLTANLDIPVIPIKIEGLFELKERRKYFSRPGSVTITFGEAITFTGDRAPATITKELEASVVTLSGMA